MPTLMSGVTVAPVRPTGVAAFHGAPGVSILVGALLLTYSAAVAATGSAAVTNAVVAILVSLSPAVGVGAVGLPVKIGLASGANPLTPVLTALVTNAVVAILVSLSPAVGVGALGSPVNVGDAIGAKPEPLRPLLDCGGDKCRGRNRGIVVACGRV